MRKLKYNISLHLPLFSGIVCGPEGYSDPFAPFFNFLEPQLTPPPTPQDAGNFGQLYYVTPVVSHTILFTGATVCTVSHNTKICIFTAVDVEFYIRTSGFWPRVCARALRAPVFLGSLKRQTGAARPPHRSCYAAPPKIKNKLFPETQCFPAGPNSGRQGRISFHWAKLHPNELQCTLLSYAAPY